jgi:hypothetical protein
MFEPKVQSPKPLKASVAVSFQRITREFGGEG